MSSTSRNRTACEACRVRKVKCSGGTPCSQCVHLDLSCHVAPRPTKRKPPVRGRLVRKLRESNNGTPTGSVSPETGNTTLFGNGNGGSSVTSYPDTGGIDSVGGSLTDGGYSAEYFYELVPHYEEHVYPVNPIITSQEIIEAIGSMHTSHEDAALVYAFAAVTINLTKTSWTFEGDVVTQMTDLMRRSLKSHRPADMGVTENWVILPELPVSVKRAMTCIFLEICFMAFKRFDRSLAILREAISMIQTFRVQQYVDDDLIGRPEVSRRQRLYWEAFIHERFLSMMSGFPSILPVLKTGLPFRDDSIPPHIELGWNQLIHLFQIFDEVFITHWCSHHEADPESRPVTVEWIQTKLAQLDQDELRSTDDNQAMQAVGLSGLNELQHSDLYITRLWMRTLVWQLALYHRLLSSAPPLDSHEGLSLHFPAQRLSAELRSLVQRLDNIASIGTHGSGILQKLFEITNTVADVTALPALGADEDDLPLTPGRRDVKARMDDFVFLCRFLFSFERIPKEERDLLRGKLAALESLYTMVDFGGLAVSPV